MGGESVAPLVGLLGPVALLNERRPREAPMRNNPTGSVTVSSPGGQSCRRDRHVAVGMDVGVGVDVDVDVDVDVTVDVYVGVDVRV